MTPTGPIPLAVLQRIRRPPARPRPGESCDLCGEAVPDPHRHLVDLELRRLLCACRPCSLLFREDPGLFREDPGLFRADPGSSTGDRGSSPGEAGSGGMRFRAVPERFVALTHRGITRADWESLDIPVGLAFVFTNSGLGRAVACYPSPAGATERELSPGAWEDIVDRHPALAHVRADVEAVLVRLEGPEAAGRCASFIVPIDVCYELVGHLRRQWTGFDGGGEARRQIAALFDRIEGRAGPVDDGVLGD